MLPRLLIVASSVAVLCTVVVLEKQRRQDLESLWEMFTSAELVERQEVSRRQLEREVDPARRQLRLSAALIADTFDPATWATQQQAPDAGAVARAAATKLETAEQIARQVLVQRPESWRANLYVGAARYLRWTLQRDDRLIREIDTWRLPMEEALELAPTRLEPRTFYVLTQLELWHMLSEERQREARGLLQEAWSGRPIDRRIVAAWMRVAPSVEASLDVLPDDAPVLWLDAQSELARQGRWDLVLAARQREIDAISLRAAAAVEDVRFDLRNENFQRARSTLVAALPTRPDFLHVPILQELLAAFPAGPLPTSNVLLSRWLDWTLEQSLYGNRVLNDAALARLAALADASASQQARTRLLLEGAGPARALYARLELDIDSKPDPVGTTLFALQLASSGDLSERELLSDAPSHAPRYVLLAKALAGESRAAPDVSSVTIGTWTMQRDGSASTEIWLAGPVGRLTLATQRVAAQGAAIEVFWNHEKLGGFERFPSQQPLQLALTASPGVHRLTIRPLAGSRFVAQKPRFD